jgi:hypothetical protein
MVTEGHDDGVSAQDDDVNALLTIGAIALALYVASVFIWPRQRCRRCQNFSGREHAPFPLGSLAFRLCRRCGGRGWHVRPMRRFLGGRSKFDGSGVWQGP